MKYLVICLTFLSFIFITYGESSSNRSSSDECGKSVSNREEEEDRIINGTKAVLGQFPWMARLGIRHRTRRTIFNCGGSLINQKFVLTAAHCGEFNEIVRLGQTFALLKQCQNDTCAPPYQDIKIKRFIFEDYCRVSRANDVMLVEMQRPATLNDFVQPICLPHPYLKTHLVDRIVSAAGFGRTVADENNANYAGLEYFSAPIRNPRDCKDRYEDFDEKRHFCLSGAKGKSVCKGDAGGGIFTVTNIDNGRRAYLVGIISYVTDDCYPETNSVHQLVEYFLQRILTHINN